MGTEFLTISGTVLKKCAKEATGKILIPEGVTEIVWAAFSGCTSLTKVVIPEGVTEIGAYAFDGCSSLTEIVIPECFRKRVKKIFGDGFNRKCLNFYKTSNVNGAE